MKHIRNILTFWLHKEKRSRANHIDVERRNIWTCALMKLLNCPCAHLFIQLLLGAVSERGQISPVLWLNHGYCLSIHPIEEMMFHIWKKSNANVMFLMWLTVAVCIIFIYSVEPINPSLSSIHFKSLWRQLQIIFDNLLRIINLYFISFCCSSPIHPSCCSSCKLEYIASFELCWISLRVCTQESLLQ